MDAAGLLGLVLLWFLGGPRSKPAGGGGGGRTRQPPQLPAGQQTSAPPWPQEAPSGLPPFPGAGWQYDEPPPAAVVQRAGQLVSSLWSAGAGTFKIEQTGGRWIAYRAEQVRSGKKGVVAYRVKSGAAKTNTKDRASTTLPAAPAVDVHYLPPQLEQILASTAAAPAGAKVVKVLAGHWYQYSMLVQGPAGLAEEIARGIGLAGGLNIAVSSTPPYAVGFQILQRVSGNIPLGVAVELTVEGTKCSLTYLRIAEISPPAYGPPPPPAAPAKPKPGPDAGPPIMASTAPSSEEFPSSNLRTLPTLRRGDGIKPKPPNPDVKLMQQKLGIHDDGQFGKDTDAALRAYQKSHGLKVDGECGPKTWTSLLAGF